MMDELIREAEALGIPNPTLYRLLRPEMREKMLRDDIEKQKKLIEEGKI